MINKIVCPYCNQYTEKENPCSFCGGPTAGQRPATEWFILDKPCFGKQPGDVIELQYKDAVAFFDKLHPANSEWNLSQFPEKALQRYQAYVKSKAFRMLDEYKTLNESHFDTLGENDNHS